MSERYEIRGKLGRGGMSAVYLAFDSVMGREVAIKRLLPLEETNLNENAGGALASEAAALARFQHPNIVTVYAFEEDDDGPYVVMERVDGEDLHHVLQDGALSVDDFQDIAVQCLEPLISASELGLLHRDIKPGNIMLTMTPSERFLVKILDFGLAKFSQQPSTQTLDQAGSFLGSIDYIAPEQLELLPLDQRTDLYSLGCVLYYSLAQKAPFSGDNPARTTMNHLNHRVVPIHELRADVPVAIADWLMSMIARNPDDRPANALDALQRFRAAERGETVESVRAPEVDRATGPVTGDVLPPGEGVSADSAVDVVKRPVIHTSPQIPRPRPTGTSPAPAALKGDRSDHAVNWRNPVVIGGSSLVILGVLIFVLFGGGDEVEPARPEPVGEAVPVLEAVEQSPETEKAPFTLPDVYELPGTPFELAALPDDPPAFQRFAAAEGMLTKAFEPADRDGGRVAAWIDLVNRKKFRSLYATFNDQFASQIPVSGILTPTQLPVVKGPTRAAVFNRHEALTIRTGPLPLKNGFTVFFVGKMQPGAGRQIHLEPAGGGGQVAGVKIDFSNNVVGSTRIGAAMNEEVLKVPWDRPAAGVIGYGSSPTAGRHHLVSLPASSFESMAAAGAYSPMKSPLDRLFVGENNQGADAEGPAVTWVFELVVYDRLLPVGKMEEISRRLAAFYFQQP